MPDSLRVSSGGFVTLLSVMLLLTLAIWLMLSAYEWAQLGVLSRQPALAVDQDASQ